MSEAYAFDIDGVIVDVSERLRHALTLSEGDRREFWELFFSEELMRLDKPREIGVRLVRDRAARGEVVVITGRPARLKELTVKSFIKLTGVKPAAIFMRGNRDLRPSPKVKAELLGRALGEGFNIIEYHDDSEEVLNEVRARYPWIKLYLHVGGDVLKY